MLTIDDSVTITVEDGKTVIPDLFNVIDEVELQQINDTIFKQSQVVITETMTINDANTEPGPAHVMTNQSM